MIREQIPRKSGFWAFGRLCALLGFVTSDRKDRKHLKSMHLLGSDVTLLEQEVRTSTTAGRAQKLRGEIAAILETSALTPAGASKLRGRLRCFTSLLMGRLGRGMMGPSIRRQYGTHARTLTPDLRRNLLWRYNAAGKLPPRTIPLSLLSPLGARSDAQGHGHIAMRALCPRDISISTRLPKWFLEMAFAADAESPIYLFELAATILTACEVAYRSDGNHRTCVLCVDSKAAFATLVKGSSSSALGNVLVNLFWSLAARCPVVRRFEYVNTKSNAADPPSRVCDTPLGVDCARSSGEIPPEFSRLFPPRGVLRRESTPTCK